MRMWRWIVVGLAILAFVALVFPLVLTQNQLRETQSDLVRARGVITGLKTELDLANKARDESEANLKSGKLANPGIEDGVERSKVTDRKANASA